MDGERSEMRNPVGSFGIWMRVACAVLLLSLGMAHKPVYAQSAVSPADAAYRLPDGSFAMLCFGGGADRGKSKSAGRGCEACRIASGTLLPSPPGDHRPAPGGYRDIAFPVRTAFLAPGGWRPGSPVRGPPFVLT